MKFTMFVTSDAMQVNLSPENEHEVRFLGMLNRAGGRVTLHNGVSLNECRGGYVRDFGTSERDLAIHIENAPAGRTPAEVALLELVEVKALKERFEAMNDPDRVEARAQLEAEYRERQPLAWKAARTVLGGGA